MMNELSREFQIFTKPVGSLCNISCRYCYYLDKKILYPGEKDFLMTDLILEKYIVQHIRATSEKNLFFSWHGGEPLLAGLDFFRKVIKIQNKHKPVDSKIVNGIQTNGILLDDDWCNFFAEEGFFVGISIDGPRDLHNKFRRTKADSTTFQKVIRGYELLKSKGIIPEILCVVHAENVNYPNSVYNFFKQLGAEYITFLPLVEKDDNSSTGVSRNSVPALQFGYFLSAIFDEWVERDIGRVKVQIFEEAARIAFDQEHTLCIFRVNCGGVPVVEHTGDFYSCDHYVDRQHFLGNIRDHSLSSFLDSPEQNAFGRSKSETLPGLCLECEVKSMCNGECPKNRFIKTPSGEEGLNYLCSGYKYFFNHCHPFVEAIRLANRKKGPLI
jgi:uncharacterized protein